MAWDEPGLQRLKDRIPFAAFISVMTVVFVEGGAAKSDGIIAFEDEVAEMLVRPFVERIEGTQRH